MITAPTFPSHCVYSLPDIAGIGLSFERLHHTDLVGALEGGYVGFQEKSRIAQLRLAEKLRHVLARIPDGKGEPFAAARPFEHDYHCVRHNAVLRINRGPSVYSERARHRNGTRRS